MAAVCRVWVPALGVSVFDRRFRSKQFGSGPFYIEEGLPDEAIVTWREGDVRKSICHGRGTGSPFPAAGIDTFVKALRDRGVQKNGGISDVIVHPWKNRPNRQSEPRRPYLGDDHPIARPWHAQRELRSAA